MKAQEFTVNYAENVRRPIKMTTDVPPPSTTAASVLQDSFNNNAEDSMHFKTPQPRRSTTAAAAARQQQVIKDRTTFYNELMAFHEKIGTPITRFPKISGNEVDLHQLYSCMVARGGWMKVNLRDEWEEILTDMNLQETCVNITIAIKQIYIRYLDRYEKVYFLGESIDRADDEDEEGEKMHVKRLSSRTLHAIPQTYNHHQHYLSESTRAAHKLPANPRRQSEYDKLLLSLMSPLPNEQDFAINVCTLMSNEGRHMLKLDRCPRLLDTLMAHAGIFNSLNMREIFTDFYTNIRKHSLESFWKDCLADKKHFLELGYEDFFTTAEKDDESLNEVLVARDTLQLTDGTQNLELIAKKLNISSDLKDLDFLSLARGLGTHDYIGQRIHQIATILRNLSFIDENTGTLSRNRSFLRLLVMMANVRWSNLHHMGLDMLGNVAPEVELMDPTMDTLTRCVMTTVTDGLESPDRGVIISCLEILSKLLQKECNEDAIHKCLTQKIYNQICVFLCLNDIMLLLYTLECIYSLSSLGEKACTKLMNVRGIIDTLVSLVTVEAQSYGPDACILMRVVETIPSNMLHHHQQQKQHSVTTQQLHIQNEPISSIPATITVQSAPEPPKIPIQGTGPPQIITTTQPNAAQNQIIQNIQTALMGPPAVVQPPTTTTMPPQQPTATSTPSKTLISSDSQQTLQQQQQQPPNSMLSPNSVSAKHAQQQLIQENEQFAYAWLRATVEPAPTNVAQNRIEQQELYKLYMQASQKIGRRGVLSPIHFPRCVRTVFGGTIGPNQCRMEQNGVEIIQFYYEGLKLRQSPLPVMHKAPVPQSTSPLLQQVLQSANPGEKNIVIVQQPSQQQQLPTTNSPSVSVSANAPASTSMHIRSLLANKVAQRQLQKQKDQLGMANAVNNTSIVVNANNPNNPTNIKLGNSTISIKPGTLPNNTVITATNQLAASNPPPLAPLSQTVIKPMNQQPQEMDGNIIPAHIIKKGGMKIDPTDINSNNGNQKMSANKMLADLLEKKSDPPSFEVGVKRKVDGMTDANEMQPPMKRQENGELQPGDLIKTNGEEKSCKKAADLYAELAGSILEDEDIEEVSTPPVKEQKLVVAMPKTGGGIATSPQQQNQGGKVITVPVPLQRQIIMTTPGNPPQTQQMISVTPSNVPQQTATIKTDAGYQTVPIILQQGQKQVAINPPQNQQYILATNQQGQTVMVPTQSANPHGIHHPGQQTVLLAQSPQQHGQPTKTIIILQQPGGQVSAIATNPQGIQQATQQTQPQPQQGQKVIMTTPQGQQVLVTQMPRPGQQLQANNLIGTAPGGQKIFFTRNAAGELELQKQGQQVILASKDQTQTGQFVLQQSPGGTQQLVNIVQQGVQPQRGQQIVIQATQAPQQPQQPAPPQVQVTQTTIPGTPNQHQIVIQKQAPTSQTIQQQVPAPPQMQIQAKTVIVNKSGGNVIVEEKSDVEMEQIHVNGVDGVDSPVMENGGSVSTSATNSACQSPTVPAATTNNAPSQTIQMIPAMDPAKCIEEDVDPSWLWICDWRGCPKKKFKSANEVYLHACAVHCPDNIDPNADIYCQWGPGPGLCDNLPRKRFSLMTHIFDRHCMPDSFRAAVKRRLSNSNDTPKQPYPVTLIRQPSPCGDQEKSNASGPGQLQNAGSAALQAIKRHMIDFPAAKELTSVLGSLLSTPSTIQATSSPNNASSSSITTISSSETSTNATVGTVTPPIASSATATTTTTATTNSTNNNSNTNSNNNINSNNSNNSNNGSCNLGTNNIGGGIPFPRDDNEGPVTKSIRLTSALILRNLVNYSALAKRNLRHYEPHLAGVALSNVESSRTIAQVLYDMNETHPV